jgi:cytochrome c-type biogenesis protein CcmH
MKVLIVLLLVLGAAASALAREAVPLARNEAVEQRMLAITRDLRCLVCQNESLAASQADLARDLRNEIRGLIIQGKTDRQIVDFLVDRYGNYVRYRPPFDIETLPLWAGPFALLIAGIAALLIYIRRRATSAEPPLDDAQRERARQLLAEAGFEDPR